MQYTGIYTISQTYTAMAAADTLLELTAASDTGVDLLRAWVGPRGAVLDQVQEIIIWRGPNSSASATAFAAGDIETHHPGHAAFGGTARHTILTEATSQDTIIEDGFHFQNGWVWLPIPEERVRIAGGDTMGIRFDIAPDAAMGIACGMTFGELG